MIGSPVLHRIDDELNNKSTFRIHKQDWRPRELLETEIGATNVLYMLIDTENKLLYVSEAANLIKRLSQKYPSIPHWNYYRYNVLPAKVADHRVTFERMVIRDLATVLENKKGVPCIKISDYKLASDKIDLR